MAKKSGLGRGLDALLKDAQLSATITRATPSSPAPVASTDAGLRQLPVTSLQRGNYQPRREFTHDSLVELAESIRTHGILQPILVRELSNQRYEIVAGERRWRAAQLAGLHTVPVVIKALDNQSAMAVGLIENLQREDLNPLEIANGLQRLLQEFDLTHEAIARSLGKSRSTITNMLRLLDLAEPIKKWLVAGELEMGHARALLGLSPAQQLQFAKQCIEQRLSVRQVENAVRQLQQPLRQTLASQVPDPNVQHLQELLSDHLGAVVQLKTNMQGGGELTIKYHSNDELSGILERLLKDVEYSL
jgi:ParB family chromosome partitioning protein